MSLFNWKILLMLFLLFLLSSLLISTCLIFKKTGRKWWFALIPFYNVWELFVIADLKGWFSLVPLVNLIMLIPVFYKISIMFNKNKIFSIFNSILPFIGMLVIAFDGSVYKGYIVEPLKEKKLYNKPVFKSDDNDKCSYEIDDNVIDYKSIKKIAISKKTDKSWKDPIKDFSKSDN